jgi:hypothetical protein
VAIVGIGALAIAGLGGSPHRAASAADRTTSHTTTAPQRTTATARPHHHRPAASTTTATTPTTQAAAPTTPQTPEALQLTGHDQMMAGNYQTAIATLRKAVAAAPPGSLTYAYGLYDLGRSMVLAGDPGGAVPILEARLKIPNQTTVVQKELNQALQASGQVPGQLSTPTQPATPPKAGVKGKGKSKGGAGGRGDGKTHRHGPSSSPGSGGAALPTPSAGTNTTEQPGFVSLNS